MRIPGSSISKTSGRRTESAKGAASGSRVDVGGVSPSDQQDSVATGVQGSLVSQAMQSGAAERSEKISELKSALEAGTYQVDAAEVSRAMVAEALTGHDG